MAEIINSPISIRLVNSDGYATVEFMTWLDQVTMALANLQPLTGTGTPEGNRVASVGRWYVDTSAVSGSGIYFKQIGDGNTGWVMRS